jgi:hypothetical protein
MLAACLLLPRLVLAQSRAESNGEAEITRLRGFAEHQIDEAQFDRQRRKGETEFLEESEQWQKQKDADLAEHKKLRAEQKKAGSDTSVSAKEDAEEKLVWEKDYEKSRHAFAKEREKFDRSKVSGLVTENEEFGLDSHRPRYDYKKRALYGAPLKYGKAVPGTGSSSGAGGFSAGNPGASAPFGAGGNFPPPPSFDDFGDGYIPPPNLGGAFGDDIPPPPPPPPMDDFNDFPPPPPPPPPFMDEGGDF